MFITVFNNLTEEDKDRAIEKLVNHSAPSQDFLMLVILASFMATLGLLLNNVAIIIGSMLIAPILYPILSLALGITMADSRLISRALHTMFKALLFAAGAAALLAIFFASGESSLTPEISARTESSLAYAVIAVVAGFAASFALVKPNLSETVPGIAISVALVPPMATIGIGIAWFNWQIVSGALLLFLVNAVGIIFAGMMTFSLMHFYTKRKIAEKNIAKNEKAEAEEAKVK